jgi:hypothetical protein
VNPLLVAAGEIQDYCTRNSWRFCIMGGFAVLRWGEPRLTRDIDLTLLTGFGQEERFIDGLLGSFAARVDDPRAFALRHRVLLLTSTNGTPLDVALGAMPFEKRAVERATEYAIQGAGILTCSAEDLVVFKAFAGREKDWLDIAGVVARQGQKLDRRLVWREVSPLIELKGAPEHAHRLRALLQE